MKTNIQLTCYICINKSLYYERNVDFLNNSYLKFDINNTIMSSILLSLNIILYNLLLTRNDLSYP